MFVRQCTRGELRRFSCRSGRARPMGSSGRGISKLKPCVVYISASNSVRKGERVLSGSTVLTVTRLARGARQGYCIVGFSSRTMSLLVRSLKQSVPELTRFLGGHFSNKASVRPTLQRTTRVVGKGSFHRSSVMLVSSFRVPPLSHSLVRRMGIVGQEGASFFKLIFNGGPRVRCLGLYRHC